MISIVNLMLRYVSSITVNDDKVGFALQAFSPTIIVLTDLSSLYIFVYSDDFSTL